MAVRGSNDFFLQFGSNAPEFTDELKSGLAGSYAEIDKLKIALEEYETVAGRLHDKGSPISLNFEGLNQAATRIEEATSGFARKFGTQLTELTSRITGLAEILASAGRYQYAPPPQGAHPPVPVQPLPPAVVEQTRPVVAQPRPAPTEPQRPPRHDLIPLPLEPGTPGSRYQRPVPTDIPAILDNKDYPAMPRHQDQEVRRDYYTKLNRFYDNNPGARDADIAYSEAMDEFNAQNKLFEARKKSWKQKVEQIRKENARLEALNAQLDAEAAAAAPAPATPATTPKATATPPTPAATKVTEEELKATEAARAAAQKNAEAVTQVSKENEAIANSARTLAETLAALNERLQESAQKAVVGGKVEDATTQVGNEVQILNTQANPVPVLLVGAGEAAGHPKGKGHQTGKATSATQQAADSETLGEAAALARTPEDVQAELLAARRAADNAQHRTRRAMANPNRQDEVEGLLAQQQQVEAHRDELVRQLNVARTPPPPPPASGSNSEPEKAPRAKKPVNLLGGANSSMDLDLAPDVKTIFDKLKQETKDALLAARDALKNPATTDAARHEAIVNAGALYVEDPGVKALRTAPLKASNFAGMLGLNADDSAVRRVMMETLNQHGPARNRAAANASGLPVADDAKAAAANAERLVRIQAIMAGSTGRVREALLAQERALAAVNALMVSGETDAGKLSAAYLNLARAGRNVESAAAAESKAAQPAQERGLYARLTNRPAGATLAGALQRHGGMALENTIGYTLVFTGFEKLRELVHSGLEAQAVFVRLQAELVATGRSSAGVKDALMQISHDTASPIEHVIEAASELAGVFHNTKDLEFATGIAAQLANISQGLLSAREAAIGLRDVTAAYGLQAPKDIQAVGDNIAKLSQTTGVSVKDITEGTTQLAQEAHDFGLSQRQTSTLAAYITQGTGEPGEAAAEQASRLLSTLYNSRVQNVLIRNGVSSEQKFQTGDIAGVLEDLVTKYRDLNPATRQELASQIGAGRQARAFAALTNGGQNFVDEFTGAAAQNDKGALARQNTAYLGTIAGQMKQFKEDFQNLGVALQRAGVFDLLGLFAKGLDTVARSLSFLLNTFSDVMDLSPFTKEVGTATVAILELVAASRLLGALTGGRVSLSALGRVAGRVVGRSPAAVESAGATAAGTGELSAFDTALAESTKVLEAFATRVLQATEATSANAGATTEETVAKQADTAATTENTASQQAGAVAAGENAAAQQAGAAAAGENAGAQVLGGAAGISRVTGSVARTPGFFRNAWSARGFGAEGRRMAAGAESEVSREAARQTELAAASAAHEAEIARAASQYRNLDEFNPYNHAGVVDAEARLTRASAMRAGDATDVRFARFAAGGTTSGGMGLGGALFGAGTTATLAIPALALAALLPASFQAKGISDQSNAAGNDALKILKNPDANSQADLDRIGKDALRTGSLGFADKAGQDVGNAVIGIGGLWHPFGDDPGSDRPSNKSQKAAFKFDSKYSDALAKAIKSGDAEEIIKAQQDVNQAVADQGAKIAKMGGNGKGAQADIAYQLEDVRVQIKKDGDRALKSITGLKLANADLNFIQAQMVTAYVSSISQLSPQTMRANPAAVQAMFNYTAGTSLGTHEYELSLNLAGKKTYQPTTDDMLNYRQAKGEYDAQLPQQQAAYQAAVRAYEPKLAAYEKTPAHDRAVYTGQERSYTAEDFDLGHLSNKQRIAVEQYLASGGGIDVPNGIPLKDGSTTLDKTQQTQAAGGPTGPTPVGPPPVAPTPVVRATEFAPEVLQRDAAKLLAPAIRKFAAVVNGDVDPKTHKAYTVEEKTTAFTALQQALQSQAQATQSSYDIPVQRSQARATALTATGDYAGGAKALTQEKVGLQSYLGTLKSNQPEYWQTIENIHQVQMQISQALATPAMNKLQLLAANSLNPAAAAEAQYQMAELQIKQAQDAYHRELADTAAIIAAAKKKLDEIILSEGPLAKLDPRMEKLLKQITDGQAAYDALAATHGKTPEEQAGEVQKTQSAANKAQVAESGNAAQSAARIAGIRNTVQQGRAQLAEALRLEAVYQSRGDKAGYFNSVAQAEQAQIAIRDAVEQQRESAINAAAALKSRQGDTVGSARLGLAAAQDAYAYAVKEYGKNSQQAMAALATVYQAQQTEISAELDRQNAGIDLQIAQLNARGHLGDDVTAAKDEVKKAQNAIHSYLSHGGKKGTADYDKLQGDLITARRAAFDTALQAQLDTLDFQRETYKITSSQEVQSLQQILKNKQLTLKEQRDITLKIKDLQQSIREQLTNGGLNIPSDIKLPTAYEVRRSLGAGFGGQGAVSNTVNNNQQIQINNNVPTAAIATQVANQVINMINQQTGQQLRANSSTPRLVPTR